MEKSELIKQLKKDAAENKFTLDGEYIVFDKSANLNYQVLQSFKLKELLTHNPVSKTRLNVSLLAALDSIREVYGRAITIRASYRSPEYNLLNFGMSDSQLYVTGDALSLGVDKKYLAEFIGIVNTHFTPGEIGIYAWGVHLGWTKNAKEWDKTTDTSIKQKALDFLSFDKMKNILLLAAAGAAGWWFFLRKK
jgi:hypothetical protein